jgi:hypothetical protein
MGWFQTLSLAARAACLLDWAQHVRLSAVREHRRGPKKPASKLPYDTLKRADNLTVPLFTTPARRLAILDEAAFFRKSL